MILLQVSQEIAACLGPTDYPSAPRTLATVPEQSRRNQDTVGNQVGAEHLVDKYLFGLALHMDQQPFHPEPLPPANSGAGRPPSSFFSQSSPRLYSSNHALSLSEHSLRIVVAPSQRSVTRTSSGSK